MVHSDRRDRSGLGRFLSCDWRIRFARDDITISKASLLSLLQESDEVEYHHSKKDSTDDSTNDNTSYNACFLGEFLLLFRDYSSSGEYATVDIGSCVCRCSVFSRFG